MFTGIIQELGAVRSAVNKENLLLDIDSRIVAPRLKKGDSVSINGVCQTLIESRPDGFMVEAIRETLSRTNFAVLSPGDRVNLEAPIRADEMFHGHFVQGHIDCVGKIISLAPQGGSLLVSIEFPKRFGRYLIEKGSVAIDGVSLTVVDAGPTVFSIAVIPHTLENTNFKFNKPGNPVNLEFDIIARYVEKFRSTEGESKLTIGFLEEHGYISPERQP